MKLVKFTKDMVPHKAGETRAVPDDVAAKLSRAGEATIEPSIFDAQQPSAEVRRPAKKYATRGF